MMRNAGPSLLAMRSLKHNHPVIYHGMCIPVPKGMTSPDQRSVPDRHKFVPVCLGCLNQHAVSVLYFFFFISTV